MTSGKKSWQCVTPGCGRAKYQGDHCDACVRRVRAEKPLQPHRCRVVSCERQVQHRETGLCHTHHLQRNAPNAPRSVRATGETRRGEARPEMEMTDGHQRWWVSAMEAAA